MYCIFNSLFDYDSKIETERQSAIYRRISRYSTEYSRRSIVAYRKIAERIVNLEYKSDDKLKAAILGIPGIAVDEVTEELIHEIREIIESSDDEIVEAILKKRFLAEFNMQIGHVNYPDEETRIELTIKDEAIDIVVNGDNTSIKKKMKLVKDIVYIDDPNVIDDEFYWRHADDYSHRADLKNKLRRRRENSLSAVEDALVKRKLERIDEILSDICDEIISNDEEGEFQYKDKQLKKRISSINVSTGMKGFLIIKTLLKGGFLEENGVVILDEPEAHLHPEWMIRYAEVVVLLHSILKINFLISTHSSEFLSFIQLFTEKYKCTKACNFYKLKADLDNTTTTVVEKYNTNIDGIYSDLTRAFLEASKQLDGLND